MNKENRWAKMSDDDLSTAVEEFSEYTPEGQRAIREEVQRRKSLPAEPEGQQEAPEAEVHDSPSADSEEPQAASAASRQPERPLGEQLEQRYRDAYRVARATIMVAGLIKFVGIILAVGGGLGAWLSAEQSGEIAVLVGIFGVGSGLLIFGVGVLIAAQGQQLLASVDDVVGGSPFLSDQERADIMRLDIGEQK